MYLINISNNILLKSKVIISIFLFCACSTSPKMPTDRFFTSEGTGQGSARASFGITPANKVILTKDNLSQALENIQYSHKSRTPNFAFSYGLSDSIDFETSFGFDTPLYAGVNVQLIGAPVSSASQFNFSLSIRGWTSMYMSAETFEAKEVKGNSPTDREVIVTGIASGYGPSLGFRAFEPLLLYFFYYKENFAIAGDYSGDIGDKFDYDGNHFSTGFGLEFKIDTFTINTQVSKSKFSLEQNSLEDNEDIKLSYFMSYIY